MAKLSGKVKIQPAVNLLQLKGDLVYEYNPFKNFRINTSGDYELATEGNAKVPVGSLLDLDTTELNFDLYHPVDMLIQPSYDGSVNVILNDGINLPRMINSRFSVTGKDTYLIVDREGDNDTNIYDKETFDADISLYKKVRTITKVKFVGVSTGGNLPVGNYNFYFKLADSDGNETDYIAESGLVTCYIGNLNEPRSIQGGIRDLSSFKAVHFKLSNLDSSYSNVIVYYTRSTADNLANMTTTAMKILKNYPIYNGACDIKVNGYEEKLAVSINEINALYNVVKAANTLETTQNMLFLGNVIKNDIPYRELADLSLRFYPQVVLSDSIGNVDKDYNDITGGYEYYNVHNIYHKLGYWNDEIYRFGVVYIMKDFTLSPVFNIRGRRVIDSSTITVEDIRDDNDRRIYIPIDKDKFQINGTDNNKGVGRIKASLQIKNDGVYPIGIKIVGNQFLVDELKKYTIGCFFVRLKRIKTTLCLAVSIGVESTSHLPTLPISYTEPTSTTAGHTNYLLESFINTNRVLTHDFGSRKRIVRNVDSSGGALCPEFELNAPFFNLFFTGSPFKVKLSVNLINLSHFYGNSRYYYTLAYNENTEDTSTYDFNIVSVLDGQALAKNINRLYSAKAGEAEEVFRVSFYDYKNLSREADNLIRGNFGPYLGLEGRLALPKDLSVFDIKIPNYSEANVDEYFLIRYLDTSPFEPISDRMSWDDYGTEIACYRGDCFIGNFTHRMCRNFSDPTAPYNNDIVDQNSWASNMNLGDADTYNNVNRGDVNAVQIGHWVTVKVCSNLNLSLRSVDHSWASEEGITNKPRAFFPLYAMNASGENKVPESNVYNDGYSSSLSNKYNYETPDVPAIKNVFVTRVMYSDIAVNDAFRNGFRVFDLMHYRDYTLTYGALIRLIELKGNLIAVFEHGTCLIPVNERAIAASGAGGNVFINTSNVLPDNPLVLSDMFGTLWPESVIKTPYYIYGVDTVGKKIWRTNGLNFEIISDFKVLKFLIDNITLTEKEKLPIIGIRNVKTHYNAYKSDVMFTYYDNINTIEERVWNLCYNEITLLFSTFYSWVPSYSANVDNVMFSFDRNTSKHIALVYYGLFLINGTPSLQKVTISGNSVSGTSTKKTHEYIGPIKNDENFTFSLVDDNNNNSYRYRIIENKLYISLEAYNSIPYHQVAIKGTNGTKTVYGTLAFHKGLVLQDVDLDTTAFWKHGLAGLMLSEKIKPCFWYGKQHPFEFEFIVKDNPDKHKVFTNLQIISNKALPESFHFEVVGEVYDWAYDKLNMYCRLEATKQLYLRLGSNIKYNPNYKELIPKQERILGSSYNRKSTYLPLYYKRTSSLDEIYDSYTKMLQLTKEGTNINWNTTPPRDYSHLSGSEIVYDPQLNEFKIWTHIGCCTIDGYYDKEITQGEYEYVLAHFAPTHRRVFAWDEGDGTGTKFYERVFYGRIKGNSEYKEDEWYVQIPSITFMLKNEPNWYNGKPNLIILTLDIPNDLQHSLVTSNILPEGYGIDNVKVLPNTFDRGDAYPPTIGGWTARKETKLRDKYIRIRVRYKGDELAIINSIKTIYNYA